MIPYTLAEWLDLPAEEISRILLPQKLALLISQDGSRRFAYRRDPASRYDWALYTQLAVDATLLLTEYCYALGIETVIITVFWPPNFERGDKYSQDAIVGPMGLPRLIDAQHMALYKRWDVRTRLTGTWRQAEPWIVEKLETIAQQYVEATPTGQRMLLWEADAGDIMEAMLRTATEVGPSIKAVREALYPEGPERVHIAIKAGRIRSINRIISPILLETTDLYITNNLILEMTEPQLRAILYDYAFLRNQAPVDNMSYSDEFLAAYGRWYEENPPRVIGLGELDPGGNWVMRGGDEPEELAKTGWWKEA